MPKRELPPYDGGNEPAIEDILSAAFAALGLAVTVAAVSLLLIGVTT